VVSPLLALHQDQLRAIARGDTGEAVVANSTQKASERDEAFARLKAGDVEFLLLAPEQLANPATVHRLRESWPSLLVVDEAHCVSAWGHDFRPDYLRLGTVIETLGRPTVLALTATASPPLRADIAEHLGLQDPVVVVRGFDRPNIHLAVETFHEGPAKEAAVLDWVASTPGPGILYVATRRASVELAGALRELGVRAAAYHGGMRAKERRQAQDAFTAGELDVIVATVAFGMGIDKPNVRFVAHAEVTDSLDSYWQEIGRSGRDGEAAQALLFYRSGTSACAGSSRPAAAWAPTCSPRWPPPWPGGGSPWTRPSCVSRWACPVPGWPPRSAASTGPVPWRSCPAGRWWPAPASTWPPLPWRRPGPRRRTARSSGRGSR
jgi:ATP-dependent DNA helicase RecQ